MEPDEDITPRGVTATEVAAHISEYLGEWWVDGEFNTIESFDGEAKVRGTTVQEDSGASFRITLENGQEFKLTVESDAIERTGT